jgi:hypothetical protein
MARDRYEKDFDDEVYEDGYYEEHYEEEELREEGVDDDEVKTPVDPDDELEAEDDWDNEKKVVMSFACEDCDYRWEDTLIKRKDALDVEEDYDPVCPMCGSMNISQI